MTLEFNHMYVSFELQNTDTSAIAEAAAVSKTIFFLRNEGGAETQGGAKKTAYPRCQPNL